MLTALTKEYPLPSELQERIDLVLESHDCDPTQIVGILLEVQALNERHYVPEPTAYYIADRLKMRVTNIFDCLKFYSELSPVPRAKYPIQVCCSPACRVNRVDSHRLISTLEQLLDIKLGETTYDAVSRSSRSPASAPATAHRPCASTGTSTTISTRRKRLKRCCALCPELEEVNTCKYIF